MKTLLIFLLLVLPLVLTNLNTRYETRYCTQDQKGGTNTQFASRLKTYLEGCPVQSGYCIFQNPDYPIQNQQHCGNSNNIGWMITYTFSETEPTNYEFNWGGDFSGGAAIYVNGLLEVAFQQDFQWNQDWNSAGVFSLNYDFPSGSNTIYIIALENCCDAPLYVQFSRNNGPKKPLTRANFECQQNNSCDGVTCQANEYKVGFECKACNYKCETCDGDPNQCLTCNDSLNRLQAPSCACKDTLYNVEGNPTCQACHHSCLTCSDADSCDTCNNASFKGGTYCNGCQNAHNNQNCGSCGEWECHTCKNNPAHTLPDCNGNSCTANQYQVGQRCKDCGDTCKTCVDSTGCATCEANQYIKAKKCRNCEDEYGSHCGTCNKFECLSCKVDASYKLPDCNAATCPPPQIQDGNICRGCINGCNTCPDSSSCTECNDGYFKNLSNTCDSCTPPCLTCSTSATTCTSCTKENFTTASNCTQCISRYFFKTTEGECASCTVYYGEICGECTETECTRCHNPSNNVLPDCTSPTCPVRTWKDGYICRDCIDHCLVCSNSSTCDQCEDLYYRDNGGICRECQAPCLLCSAESVCILCRERGWKAPSCDTCGQGFFMHQGECIQSCPQGYYGRHSDNTCQTCDNTCFDCENDAYYCTICPNEKFLSNGKCVDCGDALGMEQHPEEPKGVCREICGDGIRLVPSSIHECDDGNNEDGDGCNKNCVVEEGWICSGGSQGYPDKCQDKRPIGFKVEFKFSDQYLNIDENAPISAVMSFNKTFTLPLGTSLKDYIVLSIEGKDTSGFQIEVKESKKRLLQQNQQPQYDLSIQLDQTVRKRAITIDLQPKSAFQDGSGNTLADEPPPQGEVKDYFYYNEEERNNTALFEFWMQLSVMALMCFLPIYVFYYKNHFNRFYIIFMIIDCTQTLYFYRFLNIRWAINGIKFYRKLRPVIGFYMPNFYTKDIPESEFKDYSSGVTKFDNERESALFMNNAGSILTLLFIYIICYLLVVILSWQKLYQSNKKNKIYQFFFQFRYGYLQWGVWFDSMMASCGVFIIYIFLQFTNFFIDPLNSFIALGVAIFYFGFFIAVARYINKNLKHLYTISKDEEVDGLPLEKKLAKNHTFKLRNAWHFVHNLDQLPQKGYFYYIFIIRKIYLAAIMLFFQNHPTIQLLMSSFSHLFVIILFLKYHFFTEKKETYKAIASETLIFLAIGCMYFLLDDVSEEESYRLTFSWIVLFLLLLSLFIHGVYFLYNEIFEPIIRLLCRKTQNNKIIDLRTMRNDGKIALEHDPLYNTTVFSQKANQESAHTRPISQSILPSSMNQTQSLLTNNEAQDSSILKSKHIRSRNITNPSKMEDDSSETMSQVKYTQSQNTSQIQFEKKTHKNHNKFILNQDNDNNNTLTQNSTALISISQNEIGPSSVDKQIKSNFFAEANENQPSNQLHPSHHHNNNHHHHRQIRVHSPASSPRTKQIEENISIISDGNGNGNGNSHHQNNSSSHHRPHHYHNKRPIKQTNEPHTNLESTQESKDFF